MKFVQDLRHALRVYRKSPLIAALAIVCLALGIGANSSMFSLMNYLLLKPLPAPDSDRLVVVSRGGRTDISYPHYRAYRDRARSLSGLTASVHTDSTLDIGDEAGNAIAEAVTGNYGAVLRVKPHLGRWFDNENDAAAVVSYRVWRERLRGDPAVLGKVIRSEKRYWTIIGVAPPEFAGIFSPTSTDLWVPLRAWAEQHPEIAASLEDSTRDRVMAIGRLQDGMSTEQATAELSAIPDPAPAGVPTHKQPPEPVAAEAARGILPAQFRHGDAAASALLIAFGTAVLLIACLNIANLLLARGVARQAEIGVRMSLGASPGRILRQMLTEVFLLCAFGAAAGLMAGEWTNHLIRSMFAALPLGESVRPDLSFDHRVFWNACMASLIATLVCGLAPAWRSMRLDIAASVKGGGAHGDGLRLQRVVLVGQVALSLALLCCASMFLRAWMKLRAADPGFAVQNRFYAQIAASEPEFTPQTAQAFYRAAIDSLRALPGVQGAALTRMLPPYGRASDCIRASGGAPVRTSEARIGDGALSVMGVGLLQGREFAPADLRAGGVLVSEALARRLWPDGNAVGRQVEVGCEQAAGMTVLGIVRDVRAGQPEFYRPIDRVSSGLMHVVIAAAGPPAEIADRLRSALERPGLRIYAVKPMSDHVETLFWQVRWEASLLGVFGALALVLAAVGLYGAMTYYVTRRTREMGIRIALGATTPRILWCVAGQGLRLSAAGVSIGALLALAGGNLLAASLFGVGRADWASLVAPAALWMVVACAACVIPAIRAANTPANIALRQD